MTNEISSSLNDELYFFFACGGLTWNIQSPHFLENFSPTARLPNFTARIIIMYPMKCLCIYWHAFMPSTRSCAHCQVHISTDRPLYTLSRPCANWHVFLPTDASLCPLTRLHARWHTIVPNDAHLCSLTTFVHTVMPSRIDTPHAHNKKGSRRKIKSKTQLIFLIGNTSLLIFCDDQRHFLCMTMTNVTI